MNTRTTVSDVADPRAHAGCPVFAGFNPIADETVRNPFPSLEQARKETPIFYMPEFDLYMVTRREDILTVYKDTETFSNLRALGDLGEMPREIIEEVGADYRWPLASIVAVTDPPQHTRLKKLMAPMFTPKTAEAIAADIRQMADDLVDGFADSGRVDLMAAFADPLPPLVMAHLLGAPAEMAAQFKHWAQAFFMLAGNADVTEEQTVQAWRQVIAWDRYTRELIAERRVQRQDDVISAMIDSRSDDGEPVLTDDEIMCNVIGIIGAGSDTTSMLIARAVYELLSRPDQWERLKKDPELVKNAVEETLRFRGPAMVSFRTTTKEVTLGGVTLPEGADIMLHITSANRDEEFFEDPDVFDIDRPNAKQHLGLGKWAHACIGAPLARLEGKIALQCLIERLPSLRLSADQGPPDYNLNMFVPEILGLEVEWDIAS